MEETLTPYDYVYMFGWSGFNASVQEWEIRFAFECPEYMLTFPSTVEQQTWRFLIELFLDRKIAGPSWVFYLKTQGIPSGSCFTNTISSITNFVRIQYMFKRLNSRFAEVLTHGDDGLAGVDSAQLVPMVRFKEVCNPLPWNIDKAIVSESGNITMFLSRTVQEKQKVRDELASLRILMCPEYEVLSGDVSSLRNRSIYIDAGINSRYLFDICEYLEERYGMAASLPIQHTKWDPHEFEATRALASEFV